MNRRLIAALLGAAALAVPAAAVADPGHEKGQEKRNAKEHADGKGKNKQAKQRMYVFKGSFTAPGTVQVEFGNAHVRKGGFVGQAVTFDFATAKVVAADTNADQKVDLLDVKDGDPVLVQAKLAKGTEYSPVAEGEAAEPLAARKLIDKADAAEDEAPVS